MFLIVFFFNDTATTEIYTWPKLRTLVVGAEAEIVSLRDKARALEAKIKTFIGS